MKRCLLQGRKQDVVGDVQSRGQDGKAGTGLQGGIAQHHGWGRPAQAGWSGASLADPQLQGGEVQAVVVEASRPGSHGAPRPVRIGFWQNPVATSNRSPALVGSG